MNGPGGSSAITYCNILYTTESNHRHGMDFLEMLEQQASNIRLEQHSQAFHRRSKASRIHGSRIHHQPPTDSEDTPLRYAYITTEQQHHFIWARVLDRVLSVALQRHVQA